jgi:hypothetical protein
MNPRSLTEVSGYQERPNRVIGNALFFHGQIGVSGTFHRVFGNDSGYRERLIGFSGTIRAIGTADRVYRNVSGYRERLIGVSGTSFSGYRERLIGVSGTDFSTNQLIINTDSRVFQGVTL